MGSMGLAILVMYCGLIASAAYRLAGRRRMSRLLLVIALVAPIKALLWDVLFGAEVLTLPFFGASSGAADGGDWSVGGVLTGLFLVLLLSILLIAMLFAVVVGLGLRVMRLFMSQAAYDTMVGTLAADVVRAGARRLFGPARPR